MRCKNCMSFNRLKYHNSLGGGEQLGGTCQLLLEVLKMDNTDLILTDNLYVQDSFGCELGKEKDHD